MATRPPSHAEEEKAIFTAFLTTHTAWIPSMHSPMNVQCYHSIKVPGGVYTNWKQAELTLQRGGIGRLPREVLALAACPVCRGRMRTFEVHYEYSGYDRCGFTQQDLSATSNFLGGMVLGVALPAFFEVHSGADSRGDKPTPARRQAPHARRK